MLDEGATFAAYEVRRRIAVGGMGEVYLCRHRMLDRLDAVKVLRPHLAADDRFRRRFLREALSVARLRHPNVVTVYTVDESAGLLYLAMEYVPGEDLAALLRRSGRLSPGRVLRLLRQIADALDAAHRAHLVHRDIKPRNLLVTGAGTPEESATLVDFGISRMLDDDSEITRTGEVVGTIAYCAPEQLSRDRVTGACDQYALACVAYECLTGEVPFPRDGQLAVVTAHLTAAPPRLTALRPDLPATADGVIARAMAKQAAARFDTCTLFVSALEASLGPSVGPDHPEFPLPESLAAQVRTAPAELLRPPGHVDTLAFRVGGRAEPGATALVVSLLSGPLAVRGGSEATAGSVRWILAQAIARHSARELCLAWAVAPEPAEGWLWVNWLAHARPATPPVAGSHVATTPEAAADLVARLAAIVAARRAGPAERPQTTPRVLAVLDRRLGVRPDEATFADAHQVGVHLVHLLADGAAPSDVSTLELSADLSSCALTRLGLPRAMIGVPDAVDAGYVRALADLLPDDDG